MRKWSGPSARAEGPEKMRLSGNVRGQVYRTPAGLSIRATDGLRTFHAGVYDPDSRTFSKRLKPGHILCRPPAIALQACVVEELHRLGCERIEALMPDGDVLSVPFALFTLKAQALNRGFGAQLALPLVFWKSRRREAAQPSLFTGGDS